MGTIIILLDFIFIFLAHTLSENLTSNMKSISYALLSRYSGWTYISISYLLYFSSFSFCLAWAFISLQIQEFWLFGVHINDNIFASLFLNKFISYCMYCCQRLVWITLVFSLVLPQVLGLNTYHFSVHLQY